MCLHFLQFIKFDRISRNKVEKRASSNLGCVSPQQKIFDEFNKGTIAYGGTDRQTDRQTDIQTDKQTETKQNGQKILKNRQIIIRTNIRTCRHADKQVDRLPNLQRDYQTKRQLDKQTHRQTAKQTMELSSQKKM